MLPPLSRVDTASIKKMDIENLCYWGWFSYPSKTLKSYNTISHKNTWVDQNQEPKGCSKEMFPYSPTIS